jgi:DNA-binding NarL/FixJ family response regulator
VTLRIVVADDSLIAREGVVRVLEHADGIEVVATAEDYDGLIEAVDRCGPDVVVTDIRMPPTGSDEGIRAAVELRERHPDMGVVVLSQYVEPQWAVEFLGTGTAKRAYLMKERVGEPGQLVGTIRQIATGGSVVDPMVVEALIEGRARPQSSPVDLLTPREREVLSLIAEGRNNAAIAEHLVLSSRAVEKHINSLFSKLGLSGDTDVHRRVTAVLMYLAAERG